MKRYLSRLAVLALTLPLLPMAVASSVSAKPPVRYHLALGDSLPYGFTTAKARAGLPASAFTGFPDLLASETVNYSCPGESTASFLSGPCGWRSAGFPLHDDYTGSQVEAAEAFLRSHPRGHRGLVTLTLWGNDMRLFLESCSDVRCVVERAPSEIAALGQRLGAGLSRLRSAAPHATIVLVGAYHVQLDDIELSDRLIASLNTTIATVAAAHAARFADPAPVFNPAGDVSTRQAALCRLTLICAENDSHPSPSGQRALAGLVFAAWRRP